MFSAEITAHLENASPFYPCPIRLVNSAEILSVIPTLLSTPCPAWPTAFVPHP
jgi:hypothetical protein